MIELAIECRGTRHFYSLVGMLNRQVGRGNWTTRGRPVRKLRRADVAASILSIPPRTVVTFMLPQEFRDIGTLLALGGEK